MFPCKSCNLPLVNGTKICPKCGKNQISSDSALIVEAKRTQVSIDANLPELHQENPVRKWNNYDYLPFYWFAFLAVVFGFLMGPIGVFLVLGSAGGLVLMGIFIYNFGRFDL